MTQVQDPRAPEDTAKPVLPGACMALVAITGLAFAAWLPDSVGPGIFLPVVALLAGAAVLMAGGGRVTPRALALGGAGLALVGMFAIRDGLWLLLPDLALALVFAALAATDPRSWSQALLSALTPAARLFSVPGTLLRSVPEATGTADRGKVASWIRGIVAGVALVSLFWALFASADRAFQELTNKLLPNWDLGLLPARAILFGVGAAVASAFALARRAGSPTWLRTVYGSAERVAFGWQLGRTEWLIVLGLLNALFFAFTIVQLLVLFRGPDHILSTEGLTYAEYARQGFFQLLAAAALVLPLVAVVWTRSKRESAADRALLKVLLGALVLLTLGIVYSALSRLGLYVEAFGLTRLRLAAQALALWLGGLLALVLIAGATGNTRRLLDATLALTASGVLAFNLMNPDAAIARRNLERFEQTGKIDTAYLSGLGADVVPALREYPDRLQGLMLPYIAEGLPDGGSWFDFNLSRSRARALLQPQGQSQR
ncbi:MAG: DUF4153 domain-containing protein [Actinomycetota bacterium]